jgi:hypothetical protein
MIPVHLLGVLALQGAPAPSLAPDPAITRDEIAALVRAICAEEHGPRVAGSEEAARVARTLAEALRSSGLAPGGDDGTFLQAIPATRIVQQEPPRVVLVARDGTREEAAYGRDFNWIVRGAAPSTAELPILYVRSERDLPDQPDPTRALFFLGTPRQRGEWLAWKGLGEGAGFGLDVLAASSEIGAFEQGRTKEAPPPRLEVGPPPAPGCERILVRGRVRERMLAEDYTSLTLVTSEVRTPIVEHNVVGILPGKGAEVVLLVASYDSEAPVRRERRERSERSEHSEREERSPPVRRGASESSANAVLLELAGALAHGPTPERTLVFLFTGGSFQGRFGARHYLEHPARPLVETVLALSFEGLGQPYYPEERGRVHLSGEERSSAGTMLVEAGLLPDPDPRAHRYQRDESYAFALAGIVSHSIWSVPPDLLEAYEDQPATLDYEHLETAARAIQGALARVLATPARPAWSERGRPSRAAAEDEPASGDEDR